MQTRSREGRFRSRTESSNANVTSAVGMEETFGHLRARRQSLFTRTVVGITGFICAAFLLATLAQAWSNSHLMQQVQNSQQSLQQAKKHHAQLAHAADYYKDPTVIESEARQQLGYIRPGEQPVVVMSANDQTTQNHQQRQSATAQQGYWQDWWRIFFG